jgi:cytochrome c-type biogenesis protein CcmE
MTRKQRRGVMIATAVGILSVAVFLVLFALRDTIVFFIRPRR